MFCYGKYSDGTDTYPAYESFKSQYSAYSNVYGVS